MPTFRDDLHLGHSVPMVDTEDIVDGAVTEPKLADDSVSTRTIQDGAVTGPKIAEKAITEPKLADAAVSTRAIKFRAVTESKIGDSAVSTRTIQNGAVTNPKIANGAVSMNKLDNETQTLIQRGADSSWTPMGDYDVDALYYANDLVFDPVTNSSYLSLRADNMGHAVTDETWWMKVLDGSYVNRAIEEMEAAIAQAIEDAQQDIDDAIADANAAAQNATDAAGAATTAKNTLVTEISQSLAVYETVADTIVTDPEAATGMLPVQNYVIGKTVVPMDMYLKTGLETLVLGGVYVSGNAVKTSDGQMVEITRDIREFALNDAVTTGDLVAYFNNTYKALSDIGAYSGDDSDYSNGDYAIGTYSNLQMEVTAGTTSGTILVNGVEISIAEDETASEIASDIVESVTIDGWVLSSDDNVVTVTCSTVGAKDLAITFSANGTGVSIVQNLTLGSYTLRVFDGSAWSSATATNYLASNVWQALTITELETYATKQDNLISYFEIEKGVSGRVTSVKSTSRIAFNLPHLKKDKTYKVNLSSSSTAVFSRATFSFLRNANNARVACYETNSSNEIERTNFSFRDGIELNFTPKNEIDTSVIFTFWCASGSTTGVDINVNVSWKEYASSIEEKVECESAKYKETKYTTETRTIGNVAVGYIDAEPIDSIFGLKQSAPNGNTDYRITDYIDCENAKKLKTNIIQINAILFSNYKAGLVFYDADKNPIRTNFGYYCYGTGAYWKVYTIDVPSNAKYFRNSTWPESWDYTFYYEKEGEEEQINALSEQVDDISNRVLELESKTEPIPERLTSYEYTGSPMSVNRFAGEKVINLSISHQGCASYGDYLFVGIADSARLYIFNLSNYSYIGSVTFGSYSISNTHANTLTFSNQRYESGDEFPVLYICSGYGTGSSPTTFNVYGVRITRSGNTFSASIVKTIILTGTGGWTEFICADNKAWIKLETTEDWKWYKVNMPTLESSNAIALDTLTPNFTTSKFSQYCQGHFYISNKIYIPEGRSNGTIRVMDMASGEIVTTVSLSFLSSLEPEGIFIYDGHFYLLFMRQVWKLYFT